MTHEEHGPLRTVNFNSAAGRDNGDEEEQEEREEEQGEDTFGGDVNFGGRMWENHLHELGDERYRTTLDQDQGGRPLTSEVTAEEENEETHEDNNPDGYDSDGVHSYYTHDELLLRFPTGGRAVVRIQRQDGGRRQLPRRNAFDMEREEFYRILRRSAHGPDGPAPARGNGA